jgi:hypothetical protein
MGCLLVSVQLTEMLWVGLVLAGIERVHTEAMVATVADIHLAYMPFSHSVAAAGALALAAWLILGKLLRRRVLGAALAIGIASHLVLDLLTHSPDIALAPLVGEHKYGLGLYQVPPIAFAVETAYALLCWRVFRGGRGLLLCLLAFNIANVTFFAPGFGPEALLGAYPAWLAPAVAVQIAVTLAAVWYFSRGRVFEMERPEARLARLFA